MHLLQERVLGPEREVDGLHGHAGPLRDQGHRGAAVAELAEQVVRGIQDALPGRRGLFLPGGLDGGHHQQFTSGCH